MLAWLSIGSDETSFAAVGVLRRVAVISPLGQRMRILFIGAVGGFSAAR
jgi:hypothetical protein